MPEILSIGELLDLGNSASTAGLIPYSALEFNGSGDISGISGSAIAGGVDTTIVSAIASSYVESGISGKVDQSAFDDCCSAMSSVVSSKLDASASSLFQPSGDYYSASNPSGFITGVDLSDYAKESSLSSKLDASASSQFAPSGNYVYESSYSSFTGDTINNISSMSSIVSGLTGDYLEKSASSMFAPSGDYALSSDVSGVIDTVANNSADWSQGGGDYSGLSPIDVNNVNRTIGVTSKELRFGSGLQVSSDGLSDTVYVSSIPELSSYALSSDVSATISAVSSNSATWSNPPSIDTSKFVAKSALNVTMGDLNTAYSTSMTQGYSSYASNWSFAQGRRNFAYTNSFAQGGYNSASACSFAQGYGCKAYNTAFAIGYQNLKYDGSGASGVAFVIGDGTGNLHHDLFRITKDGELTVFSATSDTTGLKIVDTLKAISAWATANGWTGLS